MNQKELATGIGLEIVEAFAAKGAKIFVCGINETEQKKLLQKLSYMNG